MCKLCLAVSFLLCLGAGAQSQTTISATEAAKHVGENVTVCGSIASEHAATSSRGTPTFINLDKSYPNQVFTILIWGSDKEQVGSFPKTGRVCATGQVTEYRGTPEIILRSKSSWFVPK